MNTHERIQSIIRDVLEIGKDLTLVKTILPHGLFLSWIESELGIDERDAQYYMNAYTTGKVDLNEHNR